MKNKLIIITTLVKSETNNRKMQVERFVKYHLQFDCKIVIVVPDDVTVPILDHTNVKIVPCKSSLYLTNKLLLALKEVTTQYVAWIADDDFLGLDFTKKAIELMDKNQNIISCDGMMIFKEEGTLKRANISYSYASYKRHLKKADDLLVSENLKFHADNYHPGAIHTVAKSDVIRNTLNFLSKYDIPAAFGDRIYFLMMLMHGDIRYIKSISNIRSHGTRIMEHNPKLFNKTKIRPGEIIMYDEIIKDLIDEYKKINNTMNFRIKSGIMYFILIASKCMTPPRKEPFFQKLYKKYETIMAYIEPIRLSLFHKQIKKDIELAERYMQRYPLTDSKG